MDLIKFMDKLYNTDANFKIVRNKYYYRYNKRKLIDPDPSRYRYLLPQTETFLFESETELC